MDMFTSYGHIIIIIKLKLNHRFFDDLRPAGHVPLIFPIKSYSQAHVQTYKKHIVKHLLMWIFANDLGSFI